MTVFGPDDETDLDERDVLDHPLSEGGQHAEQVVVDDGEREVAGGDEDYEWAGR